jgi:hypothetical protein
MMAVGSAAAAGFETGGVEAACAALSRDVETIRTSV